MDSDPTVHNLSPSRAQRGRARLGGGGRSQIGLLCTLFVLTSFSAAQVDGPAGSGQGPTPTQDPLRDPAVAVHEGKEIADVRIELFDERGRPRSGSEAETPGLIDAILPTLNVRQHEPFRAQDASRDLIELFNGWTLIGAPGVWVEPLPDGKVRVIYQLTESGSFNRVEFRGLEHFTEIQVRRLLGLDARQRLSGFAAQRYRYLLQDRYEREGYHYAAIELIEDESRQDVMILAIDEGPRVKIGRVYFLGNKSFPGRSPFGLWASLTQGAKIKSRPGRIGSGEPYSADLVREDLDLLRVYYRNRGFRDAEVELLERRFVTQNRVDLTILIHEGPRYRVGNIELRQNPRSDVEPLYRNEDVRAQIQIAPGDVYDFDRIRRDERRIEAFYGDRGHLPSGRYGRDVDRPVSVGDTKEVSDPERAVVDLVFQVEEGTPKRIRAIHVEGNTNTLDRVARRQIYLFPGDLAKLSEAELSVRRLDSLQYFRNPETLEDVRLRFEPVPSVPGEPDQVDAYFGVEDGNTGQFVWGAGISSTAGVQARIQLSKQNFDILRTPSTWDPLEAISQVRNNEAFHGAGQEVEVFVAPGNEVSQFSLSFFEPDIFGLHQDTYGLRVALSRLLRRLDSFDRDSTLVEVGLSRAFTPNFSVGLSFREEYATVENLSFAAPTIVVDAEGTSSIRSLTLNARLRNLDSPIFPTKGYDVRSYAQLAVLGGDANFFKAGLSADYHLPLVLDHRDRAHVLFLRADFDLGQGLINSDDLFPTERFNIGGANLRGFEQRGAGPKQFGQPLGGEILLIGRAEYRFPLISTRPEGALRELELLRGLVFCDVGTLGTSIDNPLFDQPRLSVGFGVRIQTPVFQIPLALDFGFPILREETDELQVFLFQLSGNL